MKLIEQQSARDANQRVYSISWLETDYDSGEVWSSRSVKSAPSAAKCNSRLGLSLSLCLSAGAPLSCFFRSRARSRSKSFTVRALRRINTAQMLQNTANTLWPFVPEVCIVSRKPAQALSRRT